MISCIIFALDIFLMLLGDTPKNETDARAKSRTKQIMSDIPLRGSYDLDKNAPRNFKSYLASACGFFSAASFAAWVGTHFDETSSPQLGGSPLSDLPSSVAD